MVDSLERTLRVAVARAEFLDGRDPRDGDISDVLVASWRRSLTAGVDSDQPRSMYTADTDTDSLLVRCAQPVLQQLEVDAADLPLVVVLIDENARVVQRLDGSATVARLLDRVDLAPGFDYAESRMGTNGIGTALQAGHPVRVVGPEHYSENLHLFGCAGAPIHDPLTGQVAGVIDITTMSDTWNPVFTSVVRNAAKDIGRNLIRDHGQEQHAILDAYLTVVARWAGEAVLGFGGSMAIANPAAQQSFDADEQRILRESASVLMANKERASHTLAMPGGERLVHIYGTSVWAASKVVGTVIVAKPVTEPQLRAPQGSELQRLRRIPALA